MPTCFGCRSRIYAILSGFRYTHQNTDSESIFIAEEPVPNMPPFTLTIRKVDSTTDFGEPANGARIQITTNSPRGWRCVTPGINNWLFYAEGEWEEEYGQVNEFQTIDEEVPSG